MEYGRSTNMMLITYRCLRRLGFSVNYRYFFLLDFYYVHALFSIYSKRQNTLDTITPTHVLAWSKITDISSAMEAQSRAYCALCH